LETQKHIFRDKQAVAEAFAQYLADQIEAAEDYFAIALSGGSTPKILFDHLAEAYQDKIDWKKVKLFWGDERCVPPEDDDSNYKMTKEHLLDHIDMPEDNIFRVKGEDAPFQESARYGQVLIQELNAKYNIPQFDLIILGMGEDGHTASIFPDRIDLLQHADPTAVAQHPESGQKRISLTGPVLNNAKNVCFLLTGESKAEKVKEIFGKEEGYLQYPAAHVQPSEGELHWWLDEAAASKL
jgi:6-phosphogluconolactonase